jgi:hypothetical protein
MNTAGRSSCLARAHLFLALAAAALFAIALLPSPSLAGQTRLPEVFSPLAEPEAVTDPNGIAVDETTGNVFVNDAGTHTEIIGGEGGAPAGLVAPYLLTSGCAFGTGNLNGVAVDNSLTSPAKGTVYVVCTNGKIRRLARNPITEKYEAGAEIVYPGAAANAGATVDETGNLYVSNFANRTVYKFGPDGSLLKSIQLPIAVGSPNSIAIDGAGNLFFRRAGQGRVYKCAADGFGEIDPLACVEFLDNASGATAVAVDRSTGTLYVALGTRVAQYDATSLTKEFEFGSGALVATKGVIVNSATDRIYVADTGTGKDNVAVFGPPVPVPDVTTKAPLEVTGTAATLNGSVNPLGVEVTECKYEYGLTTAYGQTAPCEGSIPTDSADHSVTAEISGLKADGTTYHYRLVVNSINGQVRGTDRTLVTMQTATTEPATEVDDSGAVLNGTVRPEGESLTECFFEWGKSSLYGQTTPCSPSAASIPDDFAEHAVSAALGGLDPNATYHYRLVKVTASGTSRGQDLSFTTQGPPRVVEQRPLQVEQTSAILRAKIDPAGTSTTYHFEWGEGSNFDHRIPADHEIFAGSGTEVVTVSANLSGLSPARAYSFRVVASNSSGTTVAPGEPFETLNAAGLPFQRAFELVSPADKRPVGSMEQLALVHQLYQPTESGDRMGYLVLNGIEGSPAGGEVVYAGSRSAEGWSQTEITPPPLATAPEADGQHFSATPGFVRYLDPHDLKCGIVESYIPLTADTPAADAEFGVFNLYRWNAATDTYSLITNRIPLNPDASKPGPSGFYKVAGVSGDCSRVIFHSKAYRFIAGATGLYEWDGGVMRDAAMRPDGSTPNLSVQDTERVAREKHSVGPDGRFFFTAVSNEGADAGKAAVFVRKSPTEVVDASQPTNGPTLGARYAGASPDGSKVFFLANYGIAASSSTGPVESCASVSLSNTQIHNTACDLYAYDVETETLSDISVDPNPADTKGAVVQGVMATSSDGSVVYFAARGQLVPDRGRTYAENLQGTGFANIYRHDAAAPSAEALTFVGTLAAADIRNQALMISASVNNNWSSQATDAGSYFLYASRDGLGVNNPEGVESAYLFSSATRDAVCVSCPADGGAPAKRPDNIITGIPSVIAGLRPGGSNVPPVSLSEDGRVIFNSEEVLAPGAVEGHGERLGSAAWEFLTQTNIYEWNQGQVSTLASGAVETLGLGGPNGRDVFVKSFSQLSPHDFDFSADVYDIRSGGGFPAPPTAPVPCDPVSGACEGPSQAPPLSGLPASAALVGPGNPPAAKPLRKRCGKGKVRRKGRCVRKRRRQAHQNHAQSRPASANRGGAR